MLMEGQEKAAESRLWTGMASHLPQPQQVRTQTAQHSARCQKLCQAGEGRAELNSSKQNLGSHMAAIDRISK